MFKPLLISSILVSTLAATLLSLPVLADERGDPEPDRQLTADMATIANMFGDELGQLAVVDRNGERDVIVRDVPDPVIYTIGDTLFTDDAIGLCHEDASGRLSSCEILEPGDPREDGYVCDYFWGCQCSGALACVMMELSANCNSPVFCDGTGGCFCD
jgi:hypothetical protein